MSVAEHFRKTGHIHGIWIICILLAIISGLMLQIPNGNKVADYISFASSIASLVLAVVAIFYSIISNQSISENLGSLDSASTRIDRASDQLEGIANSIEGNFSKIFEEFGLITPEMKKLSEKVEKALEPQNEVKNNKSETVPKMEIGIPTYEDYGRSSGERVAWYIIAKAIKSGKKINSDEIFKNSLKFRYYISGYLTALGNTNNYFDIERSDGKITFDPKIINLNVEKVIEAYTSGKTKPFEEDINAFFDEI